MVLVSSFSVVKHCVQKRLVEERVYLSCLSGYSSLRKVRAGTQARLEPGCRKGAETLGDAASWLAPQVLPSLLSYTLQDQGWYHLQ